MVEVLREELRRVARTEAFLGPDVEEEEVPLEEEEVLREEEEVASGSSAVAEPEGVEAVDSVASTGEVPTEPAV